MKPFNLEEARKGHAIQTREGKKAQFVTHVPTSELQVVVLIDGTAVMTTAIGRVNVDGTDHDNDLFMVEKARKVWVNVYDSPKSPSGVMLSAPFEEEELALAFADRGCGVIGTVPVEFTV